MPITEKTDLSTASAHILIAAIGRTLVKKGIIHADDIVCALQEIKMVCDKIPGDSPSFIATQADVDHIIETVKTW